MKTGSPDLDLFLGGGYDSSRVIMIYGESATGKTTLAKLATINCAKKGKVVYLDVENSFNVQRFGQLAGENYEKLLENVLVLKVKDFDDQVEKLNKLERLENINLVVVDTLGMFYRSELKQNVEAAHKKMLMQMRILTGFARKGIGVLLTNQVYTNPATNEICPVGGNMIKKWVGTLIELKKEPRKFFMKKPEEKDVKFNIKEKGVFTS